MYFCNISQEYVKPLNTLIMNTKEPAYKQKYNLYENNEYANMPSIDYRGYEISPDKFKDVDMEFVKSVCDKYGLEVKVVHMTGLTTRPKPTIVIFKRFSAELNKQLEQLRKENRYAEMQTITGGLIDEYGDAIHDCIHELDEQTPLYFSVGWAGNVGRYGSDDVKRRTYPSYLTYSWSGILNKWSPLIHDVKSVLREGYYLMVSTYQFKVNEDDVLGNFTIKDVLDIAAKCLADRHADYTASMERREWAGGKTQDLVVTKFKGTADCGQLALNMSNDGTGVLTRWHKGHLYGRELLHRDSVVQQVEHAVEDTLSPR